MAKKKVEEKPFPQNFNDELQVLCKKYEITDASFCGTKEDKLIGVWGVDKQSHTANSVVLCSMNVARLYQAIREQVLRHLDSLSGFKF